MKKTVGSEEKSDITTKNDPTRESEGDELVEMPIDGVLDLHTFRPQEVKELINDYIEECLKRGIYDLRIIHGKGTGTLKAVVHSILKKHPAVVSFKDADLTAGGWGATVVVLKKQ